MKSLAPSRSTCSLCTSAVGALAGMFMLPLARAAPAGLALPLAAATVSLSVIAGAAGTLLALNALRRDWRTRDLLGLALGVLAAGSFLIGAALFGAA